MTLPLCPTATHVQYIAFLSTDNVVFVCLTGSSASACNSERGVSLSPRPGSQITAVNNFNNCQVNMQQGNCNTITASSATMQESFDSEAQSSDSEFTYDVVTHSPSPTAAEFDPRTLDAFGVVGRYDHCVTSSDQSSDEETYEKQVVATDDVTTSPSVYSPEEASFLAHVQPSASSEFECGDRNQHVVGAAGAGSSAHHMGGSEPWQIAGVTDEDAAVDDTLRKDLFDNVAIQPAASADDDDDDDADNAQGPVSGDDAQTDGAAGVPWCQESLDSFRHVEATSHRMAEDACSTDSLLEHNSCFTGEAVFSDELQSDTSILSVSQSLRQQAPVSDDTAAGNDGIPPPLDQPAADCWSWLRSAIIRAAQIGMYIYRYVQV